MAIRHSYFQRQVSAILDTGEPVDKHTPINDSPIMLAQFFVELFQGMVDRLRPIQAEAVACTHQWVQDFSRESLEHCRLCDAIRPKEPSNAPE